MGNAITVENLKKSFGEVNAVNGISFDVADNMLFAFLGPNGAGKSTTINMLCTALLPDSGNVNVGGNELGRNDEKIRSIIGVVFQEGLLDGILTVQENLNARASLYGLHGGALKAAVSHAAEITGITELLKRPYSKLSGGQRRRCDIARALINTPKILFLDEPTTGLDPQTRKNIWNTIRDIQKANGMTVFLTTHYMEEAADADKIVVIDGGKIAATGTSSELKEKYSSDRIILTCKDNSAVKKLLDSKGFSSALLADTLTVPVKNTVDSIEIIDLCRNDIVSFEVLKGTMDDAFLGITGGEIRE